MVDSYLGDVHSMVGAAGRYAGKLQNHGDVLLFGSSQFLCLVTFASSFRLLLLTLLGTCLYKSYTTRVLHDFVPTKSTVFENL